jgi:hypothetical protein
VTVFARRLADEECLAALATARAVRMPRLLPTSTALEMTHAVEQAKPQWVSAFNGDQFSLGNAWYTHLESGKERHYFRDARKADTLVEQILPGMQKNVRELLQAFVGALVCPREGFCGAGVHIFLPDCPVAKKGGSVHFDLEGLRSEEERKSRALSLVIMLQNARRGGGLRLWPARHTMDMHPNAAERKASYETVGYEAGDAVIFESRRLHQIEPFSGDCARISITAHARERGDGTWESWF